MEKTKVFLSDPQVLFREGIHFILSGEDDFEVTGETTGNEETLVHVTASPPNVVILSLKDPKISGTTATRRIKRDLPTTAVIMTVADKQDDDVFSAIKSGASACITKDTDPEYLLDIIRVVAQGSQPIIDEIYSPGVAGMVLAEFRDIATLNEELGKLLASLTERETALLNSIIASNNTDQIAEKLATTEETIRRNLRLIVNKLVSNEQSRELIEAAQRSLPSIIQAREDGLDNKYVTKTEFTEFKDTLMERFKSLIGGLNS
jgi:two-component system response regulator DevR